MIKIETFPLGELKPHLQNLCRDFFEASEAGIRQFFSEVYDSYVKDLCQSTWVVVEYPYVDKVYRDSYYHYFASQTHRLQKDCIRLSFFSQAVKPADFYNVANWTKLEASHLGFVIMRPTEPSFIGRSAVSPLLLKENIRNFSYCMVELNSSVNSVKFSVKSFPHSSQDEETITCAETSLWSCMEYFSTKYPEYRPVLPSNIVKTLARVSMERQLPSKGLQIDHISKSFMDFGFGSVVYWRDEYKDQEMEALLNTYIESGIPVVVSLTNESDIDHAVVAIGRENFSKPLLSRLPKARTLSGLKVIDFNSIKRAIIFSDDNTRPFQKTYYARPCNYYTGSPRWKKCRVNALVVPLHSRVYLEAYQARKYVMETLLGVSQIIKHRKDSVVLRLLIASSRSYKDWVTRESGMSVNMRELIAMIPMPKFIWVAELSSPTLIKQNKATGLILLDATKANTESYQPLLCAFHNKKFVISRPISNDPKPYDLDFGPFNIYQKNLYDAEKK